MSLLKEKPVLELRKFLPLVKVDEDGHVVRGVATSEAVDKDGEIADYEASKAEFARWSQDFLRKTTEAGQEPSLGNVRLMHQLTIAGKATKIDFADGEKKIFVDSQPVDDATWKLVQGGFVTGYSIGGGYAWRRCDVCKTEIPSGRRCSQCAKVVEVRYAPRLAEISYVDNTCLPDAVFTSIKGQTFAFVRADGSTEMRKFAVADEQKPLDFEKAAKRITAVIGRLEGETTTTLQTVIFSPKDSWTKQECSAWLKEHDLKNPGVDETGDSFRYRQRDPGDFQEGSFRTIPFKGSAKKADEDYFAAEFVERVDKVLSLDAKRELISASLNEKFVTDADKPGNYLWVRDLYSNPDYVVYSYKGKLYRCDFSIDQSGGDSKVSLGDPVEVEVDYRLIGSTAAAEKAARGETMKLEELGGLLKAVHKGLASHFKKAAAHHEKLSALHADKAEFHKGCMGKAEEDGFHKAANAFHKAYAKAHADFADHLKKVGEAADAEDDKTEKVIKAAGDGNQEITPDIAKIVGEAVAPLKATIDALGAKLEPTQVKATLVDRPGETGRKGDGEFMEPRLSDTGL